MSSTYIHPSVSRAALSRMFDAFREAEVNCHTFEIYQGETRLVRIAAAPYSCSDKRENYSLSKSFTSAAIGIAVTEGVLSLNDRIVDILPDKLPEIVSENLKKLTVRHLLTLSAGHEKCSFLKMSNAEDAARAFLSEPFPNTPGTAFCYDTGATCMLGIVLERVTGMNPLEYLALKFFPLAGIENVYWNTTRDGSTECGVGLHASCDDIAKFGILFAGGGVYNGKRLISEEYVREAGSPQICYLNNGDAPSRLNGYGYQFWMKEHDGYDAEGSFGQYCFIFPKMKLTIAMQTESQPGHDPVPAIYRLLDELFEKDDDASLTVPVPEYAPLSSPELPLPSTGKVYRMNRNPMGISSFTLEKENGDLILRFTDGQYSHRISAGNGHYVTSEWTGVHLTPKLGIMRGDYRETLTAACSYCQEPDGVTLEARFLMCPHTLTAKFRFAGNTCTIDLFTTLKDGLAPDCRSIIATTD